MNLIFGKNLRFLRKQKGLNQSEIADFIGKGATTVGNWEKGIAEPNFTELTEIVNYFDIPVFDLLYTDLESAHLIEGEKGGKKQVKSTPKYTPNSTPNRVNEPFVEIARMPKVVTVGADQLDNIVFVPARARAGYLSGYGDPEFIQSLPSYRLPGLNNGTYRAFEIFGHSMVPTFNESDVVVGSFVENIAEIRSNRIHIIVTKRDGVVAKRVINRVATDGKLILNSDNQRHPGEYPPIVISPDEILEIWYSVLFMSRQMRAPGELANRITEVESRLTLLEQRHLK
jgi:transcriptional regulator with XRE-family HTH domain